MARVHLLAARAAVSFAALLPFSLPLAAQAAPGGVPLNVSGFTPAALGAATLSEVLPDDLVLSNIGSSGLDGMSVDLPGGGEGAMLELEDLTLSGTPGARSVVWDLRGAGGTSPGKVTIKDDLDPVLGPVWHYSFDATAGGASTCTVRLWNEGWMVAELTGLDPDDELVLEAGPRTIYYVENLGGVLGDEIYWCKVWLKEVVIKGIVDGGGGPGTTLGQSITALQVLPDQSTPYLAPPITGYDLRLADTGDVTVSSLAMKLMGQWFSGNDEALLSHNGGQLAVSNLGSSGPDGVTMELGSLGSGAGLGGHTATASLALGVIDGAGTAPAGALFQVRLEATVQGDLHEDFATVTVTKGAPGASNPVTFGCDPKMLGTIWYYEYYLGGALVDSGDPDLFGPFSMDSFFDIYTEVTWGEISGGGGDTGVLMSFGSATNATAGGVTYVVDEIRFGLLAAEAWRVSGVERAVTVVDLISDLALSTASSGPTPYLNLGKKKEVVGHVTLIKEPLSGGGPLGPNTPGAVMLHGAPPSAVCAAFLGFSANPTPFKGGELLPVPFVLLLNLVTQPDGSIDLPFIWPAGIAPGISTYVQYAVAGGSMPGGVWLSNALEMISQ